MKILAFDLGKQTGFGLLGGKRTLSGSLKVCDRWKPLGKNLNLLRSMLGRMIRAHKPDRLAVAAPFVREGAGRAFMDTPMNLVPMYSCLGVLHMVADDEEIFLDVIEEGEARRIMLGEFMPGNSEAIKKAVMQACRDRGWPVTDDHAGDALCIAAAALERAEPQKAHMTTPLFLAGKSNP